MIGESLLSVNNVTKYYPGVKALNNVSIEFYEGEIHALVGENGAGKSTLVKVLSGAITPNEGNFTLSGKTFTGITPKESRDQGIQVIYQEFNLIPSLSVLENLFMGSFDGNGVFVDFKSMYDKSKSLLLDMGITNIDPKTIVNTLSTAEMQLIEIAKALAHEARVLIMDEPTAPLTMKETEILFQLVKRLKEKGVTIIYISHRLPEVFELSDRLTVMRDGQVITTRNTAEITRKELISLMVGRELSETYPEKCNEASDVVLSVENLRSEKVHGISFELHKGEILGFSGLVGAGRTELMRLIFGADKKTGGKIILKGKEVDIVSPKQAVELGIGYLPEDRKLHGVLTEQSIQFNITLAIIKKLSKFLFVNEKIENAVLDKYKNSLRIKTPSMQQLVKNLSGGNQQKVALSKWLASEVDVLIFDEPTRGIDVGAKQEIYQLMNSLAEQGKAIIMVSSEMEELLGMSDRIIVLHEGDYMGEVSDKELFKQEVILEMASGK